MSDSDTGLNARPDARHGRIPLPEREDLSPEQRRVYDESVKGPRGMVVGPLRAVIHSPDLADRWQKLGEFVRYRTVLPMRLKELAIVISARHWNSEVEWAIHARIARDAGVPEPILAAILARRLPEFDTKDDAEVYEFTRQLQSTGRVDDAAYARVRTRWGDTGIVELTALIGYYTMVAMMLNTHHVPLPPDHAVPFDTTGPLSDLPGLA
jgi:4-carboxymuconolactone decarboxylase